jgi:hypothetical protein
MKIRSDISNLQVVEQPAPDNSVAHVPAPSVLVLEDHVSETEVDEPLPPELKRSPKKSLQPSDQAPPDVLFSATYVVLEEIFDSKGDARKHARLHVHRCRAKEGTGNSACLGRYYCVAAKCQVYREVHTSNEGKFEVREFGNHKDFHSDRAKGERLRLSTKDREIIKAFNHCRPSPTQLQALAAEWEIPLTLPQSQQLSSGFCKPKLSTGFLEWLQTEAQVVEHFGCRVMSVKVDGDEGGDWNWSLQMWRGEGSTSSGGC